MCYQSHLPRVLSCANELVGKQAHTLDGLSLTYSLQSTDAFRVEIHKGEKEGTCILLIGAVQLYNHPYVRMLYFFQWELLEPFS